MAKKVTDRERMLSFAMTATSEQLEEAAAIIRTAQRTRFTTKARKPAVKKTTEKVNPAETDIT